MPISPEPKSIDLVLKYGTVEHEKKTPKDFGANFFQGRLVGIQRGQILNHYSTLWVQKFQKEKALESELTHDEYNENKRL